MRFPTPFRIARPLALSGLAAALLIAVVSPAPASAADPDIAQLDLQVRVEDRTLIATTTVRSAQQVVMPEVGICVRTTSGRVYDLPRARRVPLGPAPVTLTAQGALPRGDYVAFTCLRTRTGWRNLRGWKSVWVRSTPSGSPRPMGPTGAWTPTLEQTFDTGSLDRSVWRASRFGSDDGDDGPFNPDVEDATFSARNVDASGEQLSLRTTKGGGTVNGRTYGYRSGTVSTEGTFAFGDDTFVEARVRIPRQAGLWPAFWAVPQGDWPPEVDVFEFFDTGSDSRPAFNFHYRDGAGRNQQTGPRRYGDPAVDYREGWHTYGLQRTDGRLIPWLDGVPYPEVAASGLDDTPLFLILNLSVRKGAQAPAGQSMDVSHVRAWHQG